MIMIYSSVYPLVRHSCAHSSIVTASDFNTVAYFPRAILIFAIVVLIYNSAPALKFDSIVSNSVLKDVPIIFIII